MEPRDKNRFYLLWTLAIFLCTALAVFVLLYASFTNPGDSRPDPTPTDQSQSLETDT